MKTIYVTLFLAVISMSASAQSFVWCPSGAQWHYDINWFAITGYVDLRYVSDTVVDGINCKKILECSESIDQQNGNTSPYDCSFVHFTYESNGVIYAYGFNGWDTLFNLNSFPGDTWHLYSGGVDEVVEVLDTGHQFIQNLNLRWLRVTYPNSIQSSIIDTIVERIGCINFNYPYLPSVTSTDPEIAGFCNYSDDLFSDWRNADLVCTDLPTGIAERNPETRFGFHPNPADNEITLSTLQTGMLIITNSLGEALLTLPIKNNRVTISTKNIEEGIYFLSFQTANISQTRKLLIQH